MLNAASARCRFPRRYSLASPDSADSQFFICFDDTPHLDGQYTVWGQVTSGMEHVDAIKMGDARANGAVQDPDSIIAMKMAADAVD